jgi:hypothetical protein
MLKNTASQKVAVFAYDTVNEIPKTGDAANITAFISKNGAAPAQSNDVHPTELDAVNMPGIYQFDLTQAETNCDSFVLYAKSSTEGVEFDVVKEKTEATSLIAKVLANKQVQNKTTGVITIYDDDGVTPILLLTPTDEGNNITLTPSEPE